MRVVGEAFVVGVVVVGVPRARHSRGGLFAWAPWWSLRGGLPLPHPATNAVSATLAQIHREEIAIVRVGIGWTGGSMLASRFAAPTAPGCR